MGVVVRRYNNYVKIKNHPRSLDPSTLCALLSCKLNCNSSCFNLHTPEELLSKANQSKANHATVYRVE